MQITWRADPKDDETAFAAYKKAAELGANLWSSATFYQQGETMTHLEQIGRFFAKVRGQKQPKPRNKRLISAI